ncbi:MULTISPECIES: hypothetical protein [Stenotrophomonas maltophilia group]|uniref:hypothetical protein n=1 Tax=Stenotrophomonas maltophilia group TaxID=995085 RepID=UPI000658B3CD|nr:hypothetical protein [Stenotrophomonas maltophilia]CRR10644.1 hypothetical protein PAERUG_E15_London_28_01_14_07905 [Pseudomonas aeruginosa]
MQGKCPKCDKAAVRINTEKQTTVVGGIQTHILVFSTSCCHVIVSVALDPKEIVKRIG